MAMKWAIELLPEQPNYINRWDWRQEFHKKALLKGTRRASMLRQMMVLKGRDDGDCWTTVSRNGFAQIKRCLKAFIKKVLRKWSQTPIHRMTFAPEISTISSKKISTLSRKCLKLFTGRNLFILLTKRKVLIGIAISETLNIKQFYKLFQKLNDDVSFKCHLFKGM